MSDKEIHQGGCVCGENRYETTGIQKELEFITVDIANQDQVVLLALVLGLKKNNIIHKIIININL